MNVLTNVIYDFGGGVRPDYTIKVALQAYPRGEHRDAVADQVFPLLKDMESLRVGESITDRILDFAIRREINPVRNQWSRLDPLFMSGKVPEKVNLRTDKVMVPLYNKMDKYIAHWTLAIVDCEARVLRHYNSMRCYQPTALNPFFELVSQQFQIEKLIEDTNFEQQDPQSNDCGLFVVAKARQAVSIEEPRQIDGTAMRVDIAVGAVGAFWLRYFSDDDDLDIDARWKDGEERADEEV